MTVEAQKTISDLMDERDDLDRRLDDQAECVRELTKGLALVAKQRDEGKELLGELLYAMEDDCECSIGFICGRCSAISEARRFLS